MRSRQADAAVDWARSLRLPVAAGIGLCSASVVSGAGAQDIADGGPQETIIVTARKLQLNLLPQKILNTPQSINIVPAEVIRQQGVNNLQDALKNVPGITLNAGEGGTHGDLVNLRGFSAGDDYFLDGLRDTELYSRDVFDYDAVEVYKGPASTLFGRGSTGGVINQVTKSPTQGWHGGASFTGGGNDYYRGTADLNIPITDNAAFRIAGMGQSSDTNDRPGHVGRWGLAPSIALGMRTDTTVTLKYLHQSENNLPDYGIPFLFGKPAPVPRSANYGLPADDEFSTDVDVVTGTFEHEFNDAIKITDRARYGRYSFVSRQTAPLYGTANCFSGAAPFAGAPLCASTTNPVPVTASNPFYPVLGTPIDQILVLRDRPSGTGVITTIMNSFDLTATFDTGPFKHTLVTGIEYDSEGADLVRFANQNTVIAPVSLLAPNPAEAFPGTQTTIRQKPSTDTETIGLYLLDTIDLGTHWSLTGAVRFDRFEAKFDQLAGTQSHFDRTDEIISPRAALVYKPTESSSLYFSYGTSFNPSAENLALAASNVGLAPEKDRTFEFGGKVQLLQNRLAVTSALFDTEMTNARITDPLNPTLQTLSGTLTVKGFELNVMGEILPHWDVIAGYTYIDTKADGLAGVGVTTPVPNTAHNQANLWTTYEFPHGFEVGLGVNYIGERYAGADTGTIPGSILQVKVPAATTLDGMIGWDIGDHYSVRLNGYNLTDEYYFAQSYFTRPQENHVVPGAGRTILATVSVSY